MEKTYNHGSYPTMITPYKADGSVDYDKVRELVRWYHNNGCSGIFAVCQSSEIFYLSLEERVKINAAVYDETQKIVAEGGRKMTIVSSGHVSDSIEDQAKELNAIVDSGTDALILITNRLAAENESDDVWIENAEKLLAKLPEGVALGLYECPYPYKRLLTTKVLKWCLSTNRFRFIKDTCCDAAEIKRRLEIMDGSGFLLFNANGQTLLSSHRDGAAGYCGIMANYHPRLFAWLCENYDKQPEKADILASLLCTAAFTENGLPYPLSAKYHMQLEGLGVLATTRKPNGGEVTDYVKLCVSELKRLTDYAEKTIIK
jgi:4-hydroxy-tetrahydrodipicolinate synthase